MIPDVIIRFLLEGTHQLEIHTSTKEALQLITDWKNKKLAERISGFDVFGNRSWAVDTNRILSIFTIDYKDFAAKVAQQSQNYQTQQQHGVLPHSYRSGQ